MTRLHSIRLVLCLTLLTLGGACAERTGAPVAVDTDASAEDTSRRDVPQIPGGPGRVPDITAGGPDTPSPADTAPPDTVQHDVVEAPPEPVGPLPQVRVATWNLRNFSEFGATDWRMDNIVQQLVDLDADIIGVQELKVLDGTEGEGTQAWDTLLSRLPAYDGVLNPWNPQDSVVGLLYRRDTVELLSWRTLFSGNWWPFPRAPLEATLKVQRDGGEVVLSVVVLHLKAFDDGLERRRLACESLAPFLEASGGSRHIVIGDLNDSPHDAPADNAFLGTFLDAAPTWTFVSDALAPTVVTSTAGSQIDHVIVDDDVTALWPEPWVEVLTRPPEEYGSWEDGFSDHFPVILHLDPPAAGP